MTNVSVNISVVLLAEPQLCVGRESVEMWLTVGPYVLWVNGPLLLRWQPTLWPVTLVQTLKLNVSAIIGFSLLGMKDMASDISHGHGAGKFTKTRKIARNSVKILSNTCLYNIFETYLSYWGYLLAVNLQIYLDT